LAGVAALLEADGTVEYAGLTGEVLGGNIRAKTGDARLDASGLVGFWTSEVGPEAEEVIFYGTNGV
jgi:D-alanyl-D-alanine carboxypeptidase